MKKVLLLLCLAAIAVGSALVLFPLLRPARSVAFSEIRVVSEETAAALCDGRRRAASDVLGLAACGESLPFEADTDSWYSPLLSASITARIPEGCQIVRTASAPAYADGSGVAVSLIVYNNTSFFRCRLLETGMPLLLLDTYHNSGRIANLTNPIKARYGTLRALYADGDTLKCDSFFIKVKTRGASSRDYAKHGYTVSFLDASGNPEKHSLLGFPADTKFGLNSFYEDDSKIRDMYCLGLWKDLESPNDSGNVLRMQYAELLFNGSYHGLYGLQQLVTPDALGLGPEDVLFKMTNFVTRSGVAAGFFPFEIASPPPGRWRSPHSLAACRFVFRRPSAY